ncbi:MAG TPA: hypothetical protein VF337_05060 [Candidatus Limnocylindrales bacterium]
MRLSEWRKTAPNKESMSNRVLTVLRHVLVDLGSGPDAECWVVWGDDAETRYSVLAPTIAGLITAVVRPADREGPRVTAKLVRWSKVSVSELGVEAAGGHRLVGVQVESLVLKGVDAEADRICEFVRGLIAGIENRGRAPLAVLQAAAAEPTVSLVALPDLIDDEADLEAEPELEPSPEPAAVAEDEPVEVRADSKAPEPAPARAPKAAASGSGKIVPITSKAAPKSAAGSASTVAPTVPTPIAARAAANSKAGDSAHAPKKPAPEAPALEPSEPKSDQPPWVGPHPIEDPVPPPKPRPWMP